MLGSGRMGGLPSLHFCDQALEFLPRHSSASPAASWLCSVL